LRPLSGSVMIMPAEASSPVVGHDVGKVCKETR
jgi:hypothetical protein